MSASFTLLFLYTHKVSSIGPNTAFRIQYIINCDIESLWYLLVDANTFAFLTRSWSLSNVHSSGITALRWKKYTPLGTPNAGANKIDGTRFKNRAVFPLNTSYFENLLKTDMNCFPNKARVTTNHTNPTK